MLIGLRLYLVALCLGGLLCSATASESSVGVTVPALTGDVPTDWQVNGLSVRVANQEVELRYALTGRAVRRHEFALALYGTIFNWQGVDDPYPDRAFTELRLSLNGQLVPSELRALAFHRGRDVNRELDALRVAPLWGALHPDEPLPDPTDAKLRALHEAAIKSGLYKDFGQGAFPNWSAMAIRAWRMALPPTKAAQVAINYRVRPAYDAYGIDDRLLASMLLAHCSSRDNMLDRLKAAGRDHVQSVVAVTYSIPVGLGDAMLPSSLHVNATWDQPWAGLRPAMAAVCASRERGVQGMPNVEGDIRTPEQGTLSMLVLFPQE